MIFIILENLGIIKEGICICLVSGLGRCVYVVVFLFVLEDFVLEFGYDLLICIEKFCSWNKGRKKNKILLIVYFKEYLLMKKELKKKRVSGIDIIIFDLRFSN